MRIIGAECILLNIPFSTAATPWLFAGKPWTHFDICLVRIEVESGLVGWGEAFARNGDVSLKSVIETHILPKLIGQDAARIGPIKRRIEMEMHNLGRIGPLQYGVSAVDIALWDIAGKRAGLSLAELLGGRFVDEVEVYASLFRYGNEQGVAAAVERAIGEGYRFVKLHEVGVAEYRAAVSAAKGRARIMADVNCPWVTAEALRKDRELADLGLYWLEEPVWPPEDYVGLAKVRAQGNHRIALGENAGSLQDFQAIIAMDAMDIAQPDVAKTGGVTELLKIAALCEGAGIELVPHCALFGPGQLATIHINASRAHAPILERFYIELEGALYPDAVQPKRARVPVPRGPGLGFDPNPEVIEQFRIG